MLYAGRAMGTVGCPLPGVAQHGIEAQEGFSGEVPMLLQSIIVLVFMSTGVAYAQATGGFAQAQNDAALIKYMDAQPQALSNYVQCIQQIPATSSSSPPQPAPCVPPMRAQIPPSQPAQYRGGLAQAAINSAQNRLLNAQSKAIRTYTQCVKATQPPSACGPPP